LDLDGTLVNSSSQIHRSLTLASNNLLGVRLPPSIVSENIGLPISSILSKTDIPIEHYDEVISLFRKYLELEIVESNILFDGVLEFLERAKQFGFVMVIATSKPTYLANLVVQNSELVDYIDFVQGTDGFSPKPDPEIIYRIQRAVPGKVVALIGDRIEDIHAAIRASVLGVGVAQSAHSKEVLIASGANHAYTSFWDLLESDIFSTFLANCS